MNVIKLIKKKRGKCSLLVKMTTHYGLHWIGNRTWLASFNLLVGRWFYHGRFAPTFRLNEKIKRHSILVIHDFSNSSINSSFFLLQFHLSMEWQDLNLPMSWYCRTRLLIDPAWGSVWSAQKKKKKNKIKFIYDNSW